MPHLYHTDESHSTLKTPSLDQLLLWHQLWRSFRIGSSGQREPLPDELIVLLMRFIGAVVPDEERTIHFLNPIKVYSSDVSTTTKEWFHTPAFDKPSLSYVAQMRLDTISHDQGWTTDRNTKTWSWFEIALVDSQGRVKGGLRRLTDDVSAVQNYDLVMDDPDHKPLVLNLPSRG
jgi:hypothetical protein